MDKQDIISSLQQAFRQSSWDVRAEVQLLLAQKMGLGTDDFMVWCDHVFKREFSHDVVSSEQKEDQKMRTLLELHLSRTGLYDQLPEGLFFQMPQKEARQYTANEMAIDYQQNRKKEGEIRRFFAPFDHDFFLQRLQIEGEETILLEGLRAEVMNEYFVRFWNIPPSVPKVFIVPLILLLPHASKIAGDLALTAQSLSYLLKEKVQLTQRTAGVQSAAGICPPALGEARLAVDMVCGELFFEDNPVIEIEIGPIKNSRVKDYLEQGKIAGLLETFTRFFVPAGLDTVITVQLDPEKQDMLLESGAEPQLGYSTVFGGEK